FQSALKALQLKTSKEIAGLFYTLSHNMNAVAIGLASGVTCFVASIILHALGYKAAALLFLELGALIPTTVLTASSVRYTYNYMKSALFFSLILKKIRKEANIPESEY
ncbi:hypothetical protein KJ780_01690, partial [Candidatus Micrarchaeota archaeon]|nr:hypothetical protein [Candidatus Micrarchaeota archaeon]